MPLLDSAYRAPPWLKNGHVQTLLPVLLPRSRANWSTHERLELPDGDFVDLFWRRAGYERLALLSHGLEGSVEAGYLRAMATALHQAGWDVLAWNYRGCGGIDNRLARSYHSGESEDLRSVIRWAATRYACMALVGFSLGGNLVLKAACEPELPLGVKAVVAISAPVDLASSAHALDALPGNRLYQQRFLRTLLAKARQKAQRFPDQVSATVLKQVKTLRDFDEVYTAPLHGFRSADDYWARASAAPLLPRLAVPALLINARNDPLLAAPSFPEALARASAQLHLEMPEHGGHVAFLDHRLQPWHAQRAVAFLNAQALG